MSKHKFIIEAKFEDAEEYERFIQAVGFAGGEIVDEESDFNG